jgi:hypothetical protein
MNKKETNIKDPWQIYLALTKTSRQQTHSVLGFKQKDTDMNKYDSTLTGDISPRTHFGQS